MHGAHLPEAKPSEEQMLLEAGYLREELRDAWQYMQRLQGAILAVFVAVCTWIIARALPAPSESPLTDATIWALRERGDLAFAVYLMAPLSLLLMTAMLHATAVWTVLDAELSELQGALQRLSPTRLMRFSANRQPIVVVWVSVFLAIATLFSAGLTISAYVFFNPAVRYSHVLWLARATAVTCMMLGLVLSIWHSVAMSRYRQRRGKEAR